MNDANNYNYEEHLHRYAIWTAARAQRGIFASTEIIKKAITKINLKEEAFKLSPETSGKDFDTWHFKITNQLMDILKNDQKDVEFGRAAKIINIYLKTTLVIPNCDKESELLKNIHPPIDSILIKNLIVNNKLSSIYRKTRWSKMKKEEYAEIINELKHYFNILWKSEAYWIYQTAKMRNNL